MFNPTHVIKNIRYTLFFIRMKISSGGFRDAFQKIFIKIENLHDGITPNMIFLIFWYSYKKKVCILENYKIAR